MNPAENMKQKSIKTNNKAHSKEELEKEKKTLEDQLKKYEKMPDFGDDVDGFEEETEEAEEYSKNLGIQKALKERLEEVGRLLEEMEKPSGRKS